jgi:hypothetical protein
VCGCAAPTCTVDVAASLGVMVAWAKAQGLAFDPTCAADRLARPLGIGCAHRLELAEAACDGCRVFTGALPAGSACDNLTYGLYAERCAAPLGCSPFDDACTVVDLPVVGLGDVCRSGDELVATCASGALCDPDGGLCVAAPAPGQPCLNNVLCGDTTWCDPGAICRPRKQPGEPCTTGIECTLLECTASVCSETPWICTDAWSAT